MGDLLGSYAGNYETMELIEFLIRKSSDPGELVLDPFAGSGTTAAVAKRLGREFITIEADIDFYNIAVERVKNEKETI